MLIASCCNVSNNILLTASLNCYISDSNTPVKMLFHASDMLIQKHGCNVIFCYQHAGNVITMLIHAASCLTHASNMLVNVRNKMLTWCVMLETCQQHAILLPTC